MVRTGKFRLAVHHGHRQRGRLLIFGDVIIHKRLASRRRPRPVPFLQEKRRTKNQERQKEMKANFYMVYCEGRGGPTVKYSTLRTAMAEAERLCKLEKCECFVLCVDSSCRPKTRVVDVEWREDYYAPASSRSY